MEENKKIRVAITHGDTNGIGYELIFKTFADPEMLEICTPIIYGSPKVAAYHRKALDIKAQFSIIQKAEEAKEGRINLLAAIEDEVKVDLGEPTPESGDAALKALDRAMTDFREGLFDVLVTCPISRQNINIEGYPFPGNTRFIETCIGEGAKAFNILVNENFRMAFLTEDIALKDVAGTITKENIERKTEQFCNIIRRDFRISNPRLAILALNPNSNENGTFGKEEQEIITPAIQELAEKDIEVFGPYAADDFFGNGWFDDFDGILPMYHDQGMAPFKALSSEEGILYTANLPLVTTTIDESPRYDIAGKNEVDPSAFRHSIYLAIDIFRNRIGYDEPLANPLKKLYREKRDDSEKTRFTIPKKHAGSPFPPKKKTFEKKEFKPSEGQTAQPAEKQNNPSVPTQETTPAE